MNDKFILHQKTYDYILYLYPLINRLPKNHRLILGRKLEELAFVAPAILLLCTYPQSRRQNEWHVFTDICSGF